MRIDKDFSREAIQLVATKRPPIAFEIKEGEEDDSPMYSLTVEVKQVLRGQNLDNMDAMYTLAMFEEQTADNLEHCVNTMTVQVFPNKTYKLQKRYSWHMMHKPRQFSVHKLISRVVKLITYLTELPTPTGVETKKLEQEELLEVLENRIPATWKYKMDKEGFNASSSMLKEFTKTCVCYKECEPKGAEKTSTACKSHSERGGKRKAKRKRTPLLQVPWVLQAHDR
eukprot:15188633-Ditylum_brightwellii.AAC.1